MTLYLGDSVESKDSLGTRHTILVVDDEPVILSILEKILTGDGHIVHTASSGQEGIDRALSIDPDLILTDILMPDMDGYELTARIRALPGLHDMPIIFLTGKAAAEDGGRSFAVGGTAYLSKPFKERQLRDVINLALKSVAETH